MKYEDIPLVQIQDIAGLLGGAITSSMVALTLVRQRLQQAATELGKDLTMDIILALEELDSPASTHLGHALRLVASSFNSLSEKRRMRQYEKLWGNKTELVHMLNRDYPSCSLFKGDVKKKLQIISSTENCFG